jgi:formylglycine-generating enzyme required for sulfatase activity
MTHAPMRSALLLAACTALLFRAPLSAEPVLRLDRLGNLTWQIDFTNGLIAIERSTNLTGGWTPYKAAIISNATGVLTLPVTNRNEFFQVIMADSASNPPGMQLVPAGDFLMGDDNPLTYPNEKPRHPVYVSTFCIDQFEVTNGQMSEMMQWAYDQGLLAVNSAKLVTSAWGDGEPLLHCKGFSLATGYNQVTYTNGVFGVEEGKANNPCVGVSWFGAVAFCNWRSQREGLDPCYDLTNWTCNFTRNGYRLPTEAEWEKAARGGYTGHNFPWTSPMGNNNSYTGQIATNQATYTPIGLPHPFRTTPVGNYNGSQDPPGPDTRNGYGLYDVVGNVREWCWDWYGTNWYSQAGALAPDPTGPPSGDVVVLTTGGTGPTRVTRGGSFDENQKNVRCAFRGQSYQSAPHYTHWYHGMRCVRRLESSVLD